MLAAERLIARVAWNGEAITAVRIDSTRRPDALRLFVGRPAPQAIDDLPRVFAICSGAQRVAAGEALAAADRATVFEATGRTGEIVLAAECAHESLGNLLLRLPRHAGEPPRVGDYAALHRAVASLKAATVGAIGVAPGGVVVDAARDVAGTLDELLERRVLGLPAASLARYDDPGTLRAALRAGGGWAAGWLDRLWDRPGAGVASARLRLPDADALAADIAPALIADPTYARAPRWRGRVAETGTYAREAGHAAVQEAWRRHGGSPAVRLLARLIEVSRLPARLRACADGEPVEPWIRACSLGGGRGIAAVESARGVLVHYLSVAQGRIVDWRMVAPTEWNFHPDGAYVAGLIGITAGTREAVLDCATLWADALDPCVAFETEVVGA